ncbi:hypothetical protein BDK51DRAFT_32211 [Blyttiomyces helicus]|uniref:Uncharacterized protein n=1 Tax=Blyttiomyces helicus TaxID=388810 RepID=A0A4P9WCV9_9FUNG|nr:hypothetical protein BDK51DRAFT_32211 [Blyttiomyces helicus]|eukprot:RKO88206.1 hypothetical protein BDK51DRAFT_32211 [Blyttiomyces helicus]
MPTPWTPIPRVTLNFVGFPVAGVGSGTSADAPAPARRVVAELPGPDPAGRSPTLADFLDLCKRGPLADDAGIDVAACVVYTADWAVLGRKSSVGLLRDGEALIIAFNGGSRSVTTSTTPLSQPASITADQSQALPTSILLSPKDVKEPPRKDQQTTFKLSSSTPRAAPTNPSTPPQPTKTFPLPTSKPAASGGKTPDAGPESRGWRDRAADEPREEIGAHGEAAPLGGAPIASHGLASAGDDAGHAGGKSPGAAHGYALSHGGEGSFAGSKGGGGPHGHGYAAGMDDAPHVGPRAAGGHMLEQGEYPSGKSAGGHGAAVEPGAYGGGKLRGGHGAALDQGAHAPAKNAGGHGAAVESTMYGGGKHGGGHGMLADHGFGKGGGEASGKAAMAMPIKGFGPGPASLRDDVIKAPFAARRVSDDNEVDLDDAESSSSHAGANSDSHPPPSHHTNRKSNSTPHHPDSDDEASDNVLDDFEDDFEVDPPLVTAQPAPKHATRAPPTSAPSHPPPSPRSIGHAASAPWSDPPPGNDPHSSERAGRDRSGSASGKRSTDREKDIGGGKSTVASKGHATTTKDSSGRSEEKHETSSSTRRTSALGNRIPSADRDRDRSDRDRRSSLAVTAGVQSSGEKSVKTSSRPSRNKDIEY